MSQLTLFASPDPPPPALPAGLAYQADFISADEERGLLERFAALPFAPFEFHGFQGLRRVVSYGLRYDFAAGRAFPADPVPDWLQGLRDRAAAWAGLRSEALAQTLVTEYAVGAPIGWHRDRPLYEDVIGVSLLSACVFRFRRKSGAGWERRSLSLEPRSVYLLRGEARTSWEHGIPPASKRRYSVTFRSLRG